MHRKIAARIWPTIGLGGTLATDGARARRVERRLIALMWLAQVATIPAFYLLLAGETSVMWLAGRLLNAVAALLFGINVGMMLRACSAPWDWLRRNWLEPLLAVGALAAGLFGAADAWGTSEWVLRLIFSGLITLRIAYALRILLAPARTLHILALGIVTLALAGAGFYWLEPTVTTYSDGLWLAFTSGATVGYGDLVPTTPASRLFAAFMVLLGFALLSIVTASIAAFFVGEDEKRLEREFHHDIRALRKEVAELRVELRAALALAARREAHNQHPEQQPTGTSDNSG